ncbi:MAG: hypothetical protein MPN21_22875 [Thermoanaerobaculia bacterium]|nr:hypothetical protein [Thermoanaerobaculia bacterium]
MSPSHWSEFIQRLLVAFEWSPQALAREAEISLATINRWIEGGVSPKHGNQIKVVRAVGATTLDEAFQIVERKLDERRPDEGSEPGEVGEPVGRRAPELRELLQVLQFLEDPDSSRRHLIADVESFEAVRKLALEKLNESLELARGLRKSVLVVEQRCR